MRGRRSATMTTSISLVAAVALIATTFCPVVHAQDDGPLNLPPCSFSTHFTIANGVCGASKVAPVSQVVDCIYSIPVEHDKAVQHLLSFYETTEEFYIFKDFAVDVLDSDPLTVPQMASYIYNGTIHGQVNISQELWNVYTGILENDGATLGMFYEVNELYNRLRDRHIRAQASPGDGKIIDLRNVVINEFVYTGQAQKSFLNVYSPADGVFAVDEYITYNNGRQEIKTIQSIDGLAPMDFMIQMVSYPLDRSTAYKALGPRIQRFVEDKIFNQGRDDRFVTTFQPEYGSNPAKYWKDSIEIMYADNSATTWKVFQEIPCALQATPALENVTEYYNRPGKLVASLDAANTLIDEAGAIDSVNRGNASGWAQYKKGGRRRLQETSGLNFDTKGQGNLLAYVVTDDFAVLKLGAFLGFTKTDMVDAWTNLTTQARQKNVTRLVIDVIANGGGVVDYGYGLAVLLYPEATWEQLANPYDQLNNGIYDYWRDSLVPDLKFLSGMILQAQANLTNRFNSDPARLTEALNLTSAYFRALKVVTDTTDEVNSGYKDKSKLKNALENAVTTVDTILKSAYARNPVSLAQGELGTIFSVVGSMTSVSEITNLFGGYVKPDENPAIDYHFRGGEIGAYSDPFYLFKPTTWKQYHDSAQGIDNPFQHYILLGDGRGGSTCDTFHTTVRLYEYENRGSVTPLSTVTYGGTGKQDEAPVTQFGGGSVSDVPMNHLYFMEVIIFFYMEWFDWNVELEDYLDNMLRNVTDYVPAACYFCNSIPTVTYKQVFHNSVGVKSIPLEYVFLETDYYIPTWQWQTSVTNGAALPMLYTRAINGVRWDNETAVVEAAPPPVTVARSSAMSLRFGLFSLSLAGLVVAYLV